MKLNFNENKVSPIETTEKVSLFQLMRKILQLLTLDSKIFVSDAELNILAFVMSKDKYDLVFQGESRQELIEFLGIKNPLVTKYKNSLRDKGFILNDEDIDLVRGNGILTPKWRNFAETIKQNKTFELNFKFELE